MNRAPKETATALLHQLSDLDRIQLVLALQVRGWSRHRSADASAAVGSTTQALQCSRAAGGQGRRQQQAGVVQMRCSFVKIPASAPPPPPPGLQRHTKEVKLQRDEQAYIDDLVKKVHVHKQHSKLTK